MSLGYARPLEATDLYKLQDHRASAAIAEKITKSFERRQKEAAEYNERLASGEISPGLKGVWWSLRGVRAKREKQWRDKDGRKRASLVFAMNDSVKWWFWTGGLFKLISDVAQITSPLLVKVCSFNFLFRGTSNWVCRPSSTLRQNRTRLIFKDVKTKHLQLARVSVCLLACSRSSCSPLCATTTSSIALLPQVSFSAVASFRLSTTVP